MHMATDRSTFYTMIDSRRLVWRLVKRSSRLTYLRLLTVPLRIQRKRPVRIVLPRISANT